MKKIFLILLISLKVQAADFTIELIPANNSVGDNQVSSISSSKITNFVSEVLSAISSTLGQYLLKSELKRDNLIINGNFVLNQRGFVSSSILPSNTYGHDRWRAGDSSTQYSFSWFPSTIQIMILAGSLRQTVESFNILGGSYTLSWTGTAQCSLKIGRSPIPNYNSSPIILTGVSSGDELTVECHNGTLSLVQLNAGSVSSSFSLAGKNIAGEMLLANRYYEKSYDLDTAPGSATNNGFYVSYATSGNYITGGIRFKTMMRDIPNVVIYNPSTGATGECRGLSGGSSKALTVQNPGNSGFAFFTQVPITDYYGFQYTADAEIYDFAF